MKRTQPLLTSLAIIQKTVTFIIQRDYAEYRYTEQTCAVLAEQYANWMKKELTQLSEDDQNELYDVIEKASKTIRKYIDQVQKDVS